MKLTKRRRDFFERGEADCHPKKKRDDSSIADAVAPYQNTLGVMLPYSPLHHLLLNGPLKTLVMTSGNVSDEPIAYKNEEAISRLATSLTISSFTIERFI